jgi:hypothetical protein
MHPLAQIRLPAMARCRVLGSLSDGIWQITHVSPRNGQEYKHGGTCEYYLQISLDYRVLR